ncbi:MAG: hypothetical protein KDA41_22645 [Planctomycetales bacterium]|nr:hypothetical protein [Planctomycetales bacterium]
MTRITIDSELLSRLRNLSEPLELCDESGNVLATVLPATKMTDYEPLGPDVDAAELDRRSKSTERRFTTKEVLDYLENL